MSKSVVTPNIAALGYGISGEIGGLAKTTYYTPDGRTFKGIPNIREFVLKKDGKVVSQGQRDANLDRGWFLSMPTVLKPYCKGCDRWHDTPKEVSACIKKMTKFVDSAGKKAKREEREKTQSLEKKVAELTALVNKLMEKKK